MCRLFRLIIGGLVAGCLLLPTMAFGAIQGVLERPALKVKAPEKCILIDVALADSRLVAVGERGVIAYSDDSGETWQQAEVPVSVTLTAVCFPDPQNGWAVGHGGVVLHSTDGGKNWIRQLEGVAVAQMALENAQAKAEQAGPDDFDAQQMVTNAELLVEDGPDKPFLDLYFKNDREGIIIGSYGLAFKTEDGGTTWKCLMDSVENPNGMNLYAIDIDNGKMFIAGEQGLCLVSEDGGNSFHQIATPYEGTFFDLYASPSGDIVLVGLNGNAYWSADQGLSFNKSSVASKVSFTKVISIGDGALLFANQAGILQVSYDMGKTIQLIDVHRLDPVSSMVPIPGPSRTSDIMTVGYGGAVRVQLPSLESSDKGGQQ